MIDLNRLKAQSRSKTLCVFNSNSPLDKWTVVDDVTVIAPNNDLGNDFAECLPTGNTTVIKCVGICACRHNLSSTRISIKYYSIPPPPALPQPQDFH
ncbi:hypothetical protein J6590_034685 [Homalodisca vitripennis]|nr:hypothetical protein J6590_034685 [Homalodisca vitripennis]